MDYHPYISIDPNKRFGRPCLRNTRISVGDVLGWLASGMTREEIHDDFPEITDDDIRAALAFADTHSHSLAKPASKGPTVRNISAQGNALGKFAPHDPRAL